MNRFTFSAPYPTVPQCIEVAFLLLRSRSFHLLKQDCSYSLPFYPFCLISLKESTILIGTLTYIHKLLKIIKSQVFFYSLNLNETDMDPVEHLWDELGRFLLKEWTQIPQEHRIASEQHTNKVKHTNREKNV